MYFTWENISGLAKAFIAAPKTTTVTLLGGGYAIGRVVEYGVKNVSHSEKANEAAEKATRSFVERTGIATNSTLRQVGEGMTATLLAVNSEISTIKTEIKTQKEILEKVQGNTGATLTLCGNITSSQKAILAQGESLQETSNKILDELNKKPNLRVVKEEPSVETKIESPVKIEIPTEAKKNEAQK